MKISCYTHSGLVRKNNEDSCLVVPPWSELAIDGGICLFLVTDGMGGQNAGEVASAIAVKSSKSWLLNHLEDELTEEFVEDMVMNVNQEVWKYSQEHSEATGMGTTYTAVLISKSKAIVGHVGDSRLYRVRNEKLEQLSKDHSLVAEQVRMGKLTPEQARVHPTRNILSRVVGGRQFIKPDVFPIDLAENDTIFICSDGIYGMIEDCLIEEILIKHDVAIAAKELVDAANGAGGKDNSTSIVLNIGMLPISFPGKLSFQRLKETFAHWGKVGFD